MIPGIVADAGGDLSLPEQFFAFCMYRTTGSNQALATGDNVLASFDTEFIDIGAMVNLGVSTSQAIIPANGAGQWRVGWTGQASPGSGNATFQVFKNGALAATLTGPTAIAANLARCASALITVADGDVLTAVINISSSTSAILRQTNAPAFWGYKVASTPSGISAAVSRAASLSLAANTAATFDTENSDPGGFYSSGAPTRLTIPSTGLYRITGQWTCTGSGSITAPINGVVSSGSNASARVFTNTASSHGDAMDILYSLTAGDYVQFISHAAITIAAASFSASIERVDF